jgi:hypothetical protein
LDDHVLDYYSHFSDQAPSGHFYDVIPLHDGVNLTLDQVRLKVPGFCRGWYELAHLKREDRLEFLRDFWLSKLPFHKDLKSAISNFFSSLDDIGIFISCKDKKDPYIAEMIYSRKNGGGFFRGALPATEEDLNRLKVEFSGFFFPKDYLAFLEIHNGFSKATDVTGITPIKQMKELYLELQEMLIERDISLKFKGKPVEPKALIPFYESFGMPFFQCFLADWRPLNQIGNVYFSANTLEISDLDKGAKGEESLAFQTFFDWLVFYLDQIE